MKDPLHWYAETTVITDPFVQITAEDRPAPQLPTKQGYRLYTIGFLYKREREVKGMLQITI